MNRTPWRQLTIIHATDLHFGDRHSFTPPLDANGVRISGRGRPTLTESLLKDLLSIQPPVKRSGIPEDRLIVALTGDLSEKADTAELRQARAFMDTLATGLGISESDIFVIPGNHDLVYTQSLAEDRWSPYCRFYERHAETMRASNDNSPLLRFDPEQPEALTRVIDQSDKGLIVAEINSCAHIRRGTDGENRGEVDDDAIEVLDRQMKAIDERARKCSIRIALIHHHPVVLPGLIDPGQGYDAVANGNLLMGMLKRHAFHVVLHGHKHTPHTFTYDAVCAWRKDAVRPLFVIAGGSAGSTDLHSEPSSTTYNTYNVVRIKWQPGAPQARIHVETRGLVTNDDEGQLPGPSWYWRSLRVDDRLLSATQPQAKEGGNLRPQNPADLPYEQARLDTANATLRNFPAIEVMPSLDPAQGYEARVWIEAQLDKLEYRPPDRVDWSAGPWFPDIHVITRQQSPNFQARFTYHGPMLIQARLYWNDINGHPYEACAYVFAHFPGHMETETD